MPRRKHKPFDTAAMISTPLLNAGTNSETTVFEFELTLKNSEWTQPEKRLMEAVLREAINAYREGAFIHGNASPQSVANRKRAEAKKAKQWFMLSAEDTSDYPFAFIHICETLGIDPDYLRKHVLRLAPVRK